MVPLLERMQAEKRKVFDYGEWQSDAIDNNRYVYFSTNLMKFRIEIIDLI